MYTATPQLLAAFGIKSSDISPGADILTMRPGLSGLSKMQLLYGNGNFGGGPPGSGADQTFPCPKGGCLANPVIQEISSLPSGTSAPNTVITDTRGAAVSADRSVSSEVEVGVDPETAFRAFTEEMNLWWVRGPINFFDAARAVAVICEPGVGGRILGRAVPGQ